MSYDESLASRVRRFLEKGFDENVQESLLLRERNVTLRAGRVDAA